MSLNTTPATWSTGEVPPATKFNTEIRDALTGIQAAWDSYTPNWTANTTNPVIGTAGGTLTGEYLRIGKTILFRVAMKAGTDTTFGSGQWNVSLPVAASAAGLYMWTGRALDSSASATYVLYADQNNTSAFAPRGLPTTAGGAVIGVNSGAPFAWASGDSWNFQGFYHTA